MNVDLSPYERGQTAYRDGQPLSVNPFTSDSEDAQEWEYGWRYEMQIAPRDE